VSSEVSVLAFNQTGNKLHKPPQPPDPPTPTDPSICCRLPNKLPVRAWARACSEVVPKASKAGSGSRPRLEPAAISNRLPGPKIAAKPKTNERNLPLQRLDHSETNIPPATSSTIPFSRSLQNRFSWV
jgi:hypothetical protein